MNRTELLLMSYDLSYLMEENDVADEYVLNWLIEDGLIDLTLYFSDDHQALLDTEDG